MIQENIINVGIGFATGRKNFLKVLKTYIYNWKDSGLTDADHIRLFVFIAYDLKYNDAKPSDFTRISAELKKEVDGIYFIDSAFLQAEIEDLKARGIVDDAQAALFFTSGYAAMRNAVLYAAVQRGMDYLLFLDDDEYPMAVTHAHEVALWSGQPVLANHLRYIENADITNGYHCGYISPIPTVEFSDTFTEKDFRTFIEAISNDIVTWDHMKRVMRQGGVTYADTNILIKAEALEVEEVLGCKFISGSNLCLNLRDVSRVIPFYNPPGARGEDTFLSTCLHERKVLRIPSYAFHNGFGAYNHLLSGVLPAQLKPITAHSNAAVHRFYRACVGWVRYKPLLLYITQREQYARKIADMRAKLAASLPVISADFGMKEFLQIPEELDRYDRDVQAHYAQFIETRQIWDRIAAAMKKKENPPLL